MSHSCREDRRTRFGRGPLTGGVLVLNLVLELHQSVQNHLRPWGATRNVNIHRQNRVDSHHCRVVVIKATRAGTNSEGDYLFGLGHLVVDALQDRRHLVADGTYNEKYIRLARRKPGQTRTESINVVV